MKKGGLLAVMLLAAAMLGGCGQAEVAPVYNFSTRSLGPFTPYAVEYEDTVYFTSLYDELYSYRDGAVTLLDTDFEVWSMTRLENTLYYVTADGFYGRRLSKDGKSIGEADLVYSFSELENFYPSCLWTDGKYLYGLQEGGYSQEGGIYRIALSGGDPVFQPVGPFDADGSMLVWDGEIYLNSEDGLIAVDLDTWEERTVSENPVIAVGVENGELLTWSTGPDDTGPVPIANAGGCTYYRNGTDIYTKKEDEFVFSCSIPITAVLLDPQFITAGDYLLVRSFEPASPAYVDHNIPGDAMTDNKSYQYLIAPDGELTVLLAEDLRYELA